MAPGEALQLGVDFAPSLEPGETLGRSHQIGARLRDSTLNRGGAGMLAGPPAAAGTRVQQRVGSLTPGRRYRLDTVVYRRRPVRVLMATLAIDCVAGEAAEVG